MKTVVKLSGIRKVYNPGTPIENEVLHGVNLNVEAAEFSALIGPSGSGKSTLLNILGLLETPTAGEYWLNGRPVADLDDLGRTHARSDSLGFVFQFHHLVPAFSALENVTLPILMREGRVNAEAKAFGMHLLKAVNLADSADRRPSQLSGGMQQRVAIARALMRRPALVLADEPTGNLDTHTADDVFELLRRFNQEYGTAFLIVTHDPRLADRCDRVVRMQDGSIVDEAKFIKGSRTVSS